jgi:hypothetical protein
MKALRFLFILILSSVLISCTGDSGWDLFGDKPSRRRLNDNGFAIYTTKNFMPYNQSIDYNTFNLDTVDLNDKPFLTGEDIISYDSSSHVLTLDKNRIELTYPRQSVYGQMFIVFLYDEPVYCGFFWYAFSSVPCNWIYIRDANENGGLKSNQIELSAGFPNPSFFHGSDPRSDKKIIEYFKSAGKLTAGKPIHHSGLSFFRAYASADDTLGINFSLPLEKFYLAENPIISYDEILKYDTSSHTMDLSITSDIVAKRIGKYWGGTFVATLDDERQYSGVLVSPTVSRTFSTITIIQPLYELDKLGPKQIRVTLGYPAGISGFTGTDNRLGDEIRARLKKDGKIK